MDKRTIMVFDWMALILLTPATIILLWQIVSEKRKGKPFSPDVMTSILILGILVVGIAELNVDSSVVWLSGTLVVAQLIMLIFLFKRLRSPLLKRLRE